MNSATSIASYRGHRQHKLVQLLVVALALVLAAVALPLATADPAKAAETRRIMSGWSPYWTTAASNAAFLANADLFSDISPFWHDAVKNSGNPSGIAIANHSLGSGTIASNLAQIKDHGAKILPSITDGSGKGTMAQVIADPGKRAALVTQIVALVNNSGYDGIDLDFETFAFSDGSSSWAATRGNWVQFVTDLSTALHAGGKLLSIAVPPTYNSDMNSTSGYWVYDLGGVAPFIDKLRVMAYDYSFSRPGPVGGPMSWVEKILAYTVSVVPANKVSLGTPTYGRDWVKSKTGKGCPSQSQKVIDSKNLGTAISGVPASRWQRDPASLEMHVEYVKKYNNGKCKVTRSAWLADSHTVLERERLADRYGTSGIAIWTIGAEDASLWPAMRNFAQGLPAAAGASAGAGAGTSAGASTAQSVSASLGKLVVRKGKKARISGQLLPARTGVKIALQKLRKGRWIRVNLSRTTATGAYLMFARPTTKSATYRIKAAAGSGFPVVYSQRLRLRTK